MTQEERKKFEMVCENAQSYFGWHRAVAERMKRNGYHPIAFKVSRFDYRWDVYYFDGDDFECVACGITRWRGKKLIEAYNNGSIARVPEFVLDNYIHNGYMTRRGLFAEYSKETENRIKRISLSHFLCDLDGEEGHKIRVSLRN